MKKTLLTASLLMGAIFTSNAQTTLFEDSFETYDNFAIANVGNWTLVDIDGLPTYGFNNATFENSNGPMAWIVFNSTATTPALPAATAASDWTARTGTKAMASFAGVPPENTTEANDDWLISPPITLGTEGNMLSFWAKTAVAEYPETFKVSVSTTGAGSIASFITISGANPIQASLSTYGEHTFDLDDYAGQQVHIAIQNVSFDKFGLIVDDFKVTTTGELGTTGLLSSQFSVFPNPTTGVINIANADNALVNGVEIVDINGRTVKIVKFDNVSGAQINVSDLASGMYLMNISSDQGTLTKKIVKN